MDKMLRFLHRTGLHRAPDSGGGTGDSGIDDDDNNDGGDDTITPAMRKIINSAIAQERRKLQSETAKTRSEIERLTSIKNRTEAENSELQRHLDELNSSLGDAEERAKKAMQKKETEHKVELQKLHQERDTWRTRYEHREIDAAIAATVSKFDPKYDVSVYQTQIKAKGVKLTPVKDASGNETGEFIPVVPVIRKVDGVDTLVDVKLDEYVESDFRNDPVYKDWFASERKGGTGSRPTNRPGIGSPSSKGGDKGDYESNRSTRAERAASFFVKGNDDDA